jgi:hypothetical protein
VRKDEERAGRDVATGDFHRYIAARRGMVNFRAALARTSRRRGLQRAREFAGFGYRTGIAGSCGTTIDPREEQSTTGRVAGPPASLGLGETRDLRSSIVSRLFSIYRQGLIIGGVEDMRIVRVIGAALATCLAAAPAASQVFWQGLHAGMTRAEAEAASPGEVFHLTDACPVKVNLIYKRGLLESVRLQSTRNLTNNAEFSRSIECNGIVVASLDAKYGNRALVKQEIRFGRPYNILSWSEDNVDVVYESNIYREGPGPDWSVTYSKSLQQRMTPRPEAAGRL